MRKKELQQMAAKLSLALASPTTQLNPVAISLIAEYLQKAALIVKSPVNELAIPYHPYQ